MSDLPEYVTKICKFGHGAACCKYLVLSCPGGWECGKISPEMKAMIDHKWQTEQHNAQGDNCPGVADLVTAVAPKT